MLLPRELVPLWHGCDPELDMQPIRATLPGSSAPIEFPTHYDLACAVSDFIGLIPVATGFGLVLDDDIPMSTWLSSQRFAGGYLVVRVAAPLDFDDYRAVVESLPERAFRQAGFSVTSQDGGFLLFAAVDSPPDWSYPTAEARCPPGDYSVSTAEITTDALLLLIHRLELNVA